MALRVPLRLAPAGIAFAILAFALSLTPSLLPRPWAVQGFIGGVAAALGYPLGLAAGLLVRWSFGGAPRAGGPATRPWLAGTAAVAVAGAAALGVRAQREVSTLVGVSPPSAAGGLWASALAAGVFAVLLRAGRLGGRTARSLAGRMPGRLPRVVTAGLAGTAVLAGAIAVPAAAVAGTLAVLDRGWRTSDESVRPDLRPPVSRVRSGSPTSLVSWDSLGSDGRDFVTGGPTAEQLGRFAGRPAQEPVRVYVGRRSAPTVRAAAALAVRELERSGAFSRAVLCVAATTGRGLVDESFVSALEYLYAGDTAIVAVQYSYRPSWLSFLADRDRATRASSELFTQVRTRWAQLPPGDRPTLLVFGESLGAYAADSVFAGPDDMRAQTDGVLLVGPPRASPTWSALVAGRDPGPPAVQPEVGDGSAAPFARGGSAEEREAWPRPRIGYLSNASDPNVRWSPALLLQRPDWLAHRHDGDVAAAMSWYPLLTFAQVTADLLVANRQPSGYGHVYRAAAAAAWAAIAPPDGWTPQRTGQLAAVLGPGP